MYSSDFTTGQHGANHYEKQLIKIFKVRTAAAASQEIKGFRNKPSAVASDGIKLLYLRPYFHSGKFPK